MMGSLWRMVMTGVAGCLLGACSQGLMPIAPSPGASAPAASAGKPVTFAVSVDAKAFSDTTPITVRIWDEAQLQISETTSQCVISKDLQTGQETISCPAGVTYQPSTPEEFPVTKADLAKGAITVASKTVTVGERYRLAVSGKAADNCNTASASSEGTASAESVTLKDLPVATTLMACL